MKIFLCKDDTTLFRGMFSKACVPPSVQRTNKQNKNYTKLSFDFRRNKQPILSYFDLLLATMRAEISAFLDKQTTLGRFFPSWVGGKHFDFLYLNR